MKVPLMRPEPTLKERARRCLTQDARRDLWRGDPDAVPVLRKLGRRDQWSCDRGDLLSFLSEAKSRRAPMEGIYELLTDPRNRLGRYIRDMGRAVFEELWEMAYVHQRPTPADATERLIDAGLTALGADPRNKPSVGKILPGQLSKNELYDAADDWKGSTDNRIEELVLAGVYSVEKRPGVHLHEILVTTKAEAMMMMTKLRYACAIASRGEVSLLSCSSTAVGRYLEQIRIRGLARRAKWQAEDEAAWRERRQATAIWYRIEERNQAKRDQEHAERWAEDPLAEMKRLVSVYIDEPIDYSALLEVG